VPWLIFSGILFVIAFGIAPFTDKLFENPSLGELAFIALICASPVLIRVLVQIADLAIAYWKASRGGDRG